jgi:hypothetical protein
VVEDSVWTASGLGKYDGCLCIPCLELRLGRQLTYSDFCRCEPMPPITPDDPGISEDQLAVWCRANAQRLQWRLVADDPALLDRDGPPDDRVTVQRSRTDWSTPSRDDPASAVAAEEQR